MLSPIMTFAILGLLAKRSEMAADAAGPAVQPTGTSPEAKDRYLNHWTDGDAFAGKHIPLRPDGSCVAQRPSPDTFVRVDSKGRCMQYRIRPERDFTFYPGNGQDRAVLLYDVAFSVGRHSEYQFAFRDDPRNCLALAAGVGYQVSPPMYTRDSLKREPVGDARVVAPPCPEGYLPTFSSILRGPDGKVVDLHYWHDDGRTLHEKRGSSPAVSIPSKHSGIDLAFAYPTPVDGARYSRIDGMGPGLYQPYEKVCVRQGLNHDEVECSKMLMQAVERAAKEKSDRPVKLTGKCARWSGAPYIDRQSGKQRRR